MIELDILNPEKNSELKKEEKEEKQSYQPMPLELQVIDITGNIVNVNKVNKIIPVEGEKDEQDH